MGLVGEKSVVVPFVMTDVIRTLLVGAPDAAERADRTEFPKVQPDEELRAAAATGGDMATSTTMICASGDNDGVGDGVTDDDTVREAITEALTDGEGATDEEPVTDVDTVRFAERLTDGDTVADAAAEGSTD